MTTTAKFQLGSISTGTLLTEDLLPRFADTCIRLKGTKHPVAIMCYELTDDPTWADRSNAKDVLDALKDCLNELCPPFVYFGAHPSDGADFGFWPNIDELNDCCQNWNTFPANEYRLVECVVISDGHGNITVMDLDRNILWSTVPGRINHLELYMRPFHILHYMRPYELPQFRRRLIICYSIIDTDGSACRFDKARVPVPTGSG